MKKFLAYKTVIRAINWINLKLMWNCVRTLFVKFDLGLQVPMIEKMTIVMVILQPYHKVIRFIWENTEEEREFHNI
jgi:hypothetical protein